MEKCPICLTAGNISTRDYGEQLFVDCPRCGRFKITRTAQHINIKTDYQRLALSHWIRKNQSNNEKIMLGTQTLKSIIDKISLPKVSEQANNLILLIGENINTPEEWYKINLFPLLSIIGAKDYNGIEYICIHLKNSGFIDFKGYKKDEEINYQFQLTFKGWSRFEELSNIGSKGTFAFMAMQYKDDEQNIIYEDHFKKAVKDTGFDLRRLDENLKAGLIDNQLRVEIRNCRFLLADLTADNNGAYWEAGYAEGLGKPVIYLCEKQHFDNFKTHFDTNHHTTIIWEKEDIEQAKEKLKATIRATLPGETKMEDNKENS
jgi:nucleoside 2-deoxyribosyltransferase